MSNNTIKNQVLALFPDNNNYEISAADMRSYVNAIFDDKEQRIIKIATMSDLAFNNSLIYEGSLLVVYNDIPLYKGLYLSTVNQPSTENDLIKLSSDTSGGAISNERGGLAYIDSLTYYIGDIVSFDDGTDTLAYIANTNSSTPAGPFNPLNWNVASTSVVPITGTLDRDFGKLNAGTDVTGLTPTEIIEQGYIGEIISTVTLSTPTNLIIEKGDTKTNVDMTANITLGTGALTTLEFLVNGSVVNTRNNPVVGVNNYIVSTVNDTSSFTAKVTDTIGSNTSNTRNYTFVYPYYFGTDVQSVSSVTNLTKDIRTRDTNETKTFTTNNNVFYYCYLKSYGDLTSILDENGFETISDWTRRDVQVTGLDGTSQTYSFYEFNNITTTTTEFTFKI